MASTNKSRFGEDPDSFWTNPFSSVDPTVPVYGPDGHHIIGWRKVPSESTFDAGGGGVAAGGAAAGSGSASGTAAGTGGTAASSTLARAITAAGAISNAAQAASTLASGRAQGRVSEAGVQQAQDRLAQQRYGNVLTAADIDLARKKFTLTAPETRMSNAVHGDVLSNVQDFSYGAPRMVGNIPVPTSTGGIRPSLLSDPTRTLGRTVSADALKGQQAGDAFPALPDAPALSGLPQANVFDRLLTTAGTLGSLYPTFADILSKYKPTPKTTDQTPDWATTGLG